MNFLERLTAETPSFFRKFRNFGVLLATVGGAVLTAPVMLPALITQIAGYLVVAGAAISTVSQTTTSAPAPQG